MNVILVNFMTGSFHENMFHAKVKKHKMLIFNILH